jgi:nitrate/nitrite-specific signal transduction histidine kinase
MAHKLKTKLLAGFMLLVGLLVVAGSVSVLEFMKLSTSSTSILENNHKSIEASKTMLEALEREDSGILLLLLGKWEEGRRILGESDMMFLEALTVAQNNITKDNEAELIADIQNKYVHYKEKWTRPIVDTFKEGNIDWYQNIAHQEFIQLKKSINQLMTINQESLYEEATRLKDNGHRAVMPSIISIIGAILFSFLLIFYLDQQFIIPLKKLLKAVKNFNQGDYQLQSSIKSKDEINQLEIEINQMLKRARKNDIR